jgi:hypothetical protein
LEKKRKRGVLLSPSPLPVELFGCLRFEPYGI